MYLAFNCLAFLMLISRFNYFVPLLPAKYGYHFLFSLIMCKGYAFVIHSFGFGFLPTTVFGSIDSFVFIPHQITDFPFTTCTVWSPHWSPLFIWSHAFFPCTVGIFFFIHSTGFWSLIWLVILSWVMLSFVFYTLWFSNLGQLLLFSSNFVNFWVMLSFVFIPSDAQILVNYYFSPLIL